MLAKNVINKIKKYLRARSGNPLTPVDDFIDRFESATAEEQEMYLIGMTAYLKSIKSGTTKAGNRILFK